MDDHLSENQSEVGDVENHGFLLLARNNLVISGIERE